MGAVELQVPAARTIARVRGKGVACASRNGLIRYLSKSEDVSTVIV